MPIGTSGPTATLGSGGQRSRSLEAEDRFGGLAKESFLTSLGRLAFLLAAVLSSHLIKFIFFQGRKTAFEHM